MAGQYAVLHSIWVSSFSFVYASLNSSCTSPYPSPLPRLLRGIYPPCQSRGWGICKFCAARGPGICQPQGQPRAFFQNITTQRILLEKQADWLIVQGREKTEEVCRGMFSIYARISSLLIKPELHSETRKLSTWINIFLVVESSFSWYYLKNILSYL